MYNSISPIAKAGSLKSFSTSWRFASSRSYAYSANPVKRSYNKPLSPSARSPAASSSTATRSASSSTTSSSSTSSSSAKPASSGSKPSTNEYKTAYKSRPSATTSSSTPSYSSSSSAAQPAESNASRPSYSYSSSSAPKSAQTTSSYQQNKGFGASSSSSSSSNNNNNSSFESPSFNSGYKTINQTFPKSLHDTPVIPESADLTAGALSNDISNGNGNSQVQFTQDPQNSIPSQQQQQQQQQQIDWINSFHGIGTTLLNQKQIDILLSPLDPEDIEIKPDGLLYLPEIKYRRILNRALGPGAWGLIPRSETIVTPKLITREYALVVMGKLISVARGEQDYFSEQGIPTATEGCKSNALMRCCKDLGIGSELWDPRFIRKFKKQYCEDKFVTHVTTGKKKKIWKRKDDTVEYPYKV